MYFFENVHFKESFLRKQFWESNLEIIFFESKFESGFFWESKFKKKRIFFLKMHFFEELFFKQAI